MHHVNSVLLVGPVSNPTLKMFDRFGYLNMVLNGVRVKISVQPEQQSAIQDQISRARAAALVDGCMDAQQDKKDPNKWWYNVSGKVGGLAFLEQTPPVQNQATLVGKIARVDGDWLTVASKYHVPGREGKPAEWKERWVSVLHPATTLLVGKEILVIGTVRPKFNGTDALHVAASAVEIVG